MLPGYTEHSLDRAAALFFWSFICLKKSYEIWVGSAGAGGAYRASQKGEILPLTAATGIRQETPLIYRAGDQSGSTSS